MQSSSGFLSRIKEGLQGKYQGLSNGLTRINKYIFNVQRACYYLIGGLSGSAKTKLVDFILLNAIQDAEAKGISLNIFYHSYEIDELTKKAEWLSALIYIKYGIIIPPEKIKGLGDFRLNEDELKLVESEIPELDKIFAKINFVFEPTNPTGLHKEMWRFMEKRGKFEKEEYLDEYGVKKERIIKFIPDDPDEYNIVVIDHLALAKLESREGKMFTIKENIDKTSEYAVLGRNLFKITYFFLQQFNQGLNSVDRQKFKGVDISPQQSDFRDSTSPYADADVVLGLLNAHKMDITTCLGYNINETGASYNLRNRFRMLKVVKNRLSRDNMAIGLLFIPEALQFEELKPAHELTPDDVEKINKLVKGK